MAFAAKWPGTCHRCKGPIAPGEMVVMFNRPAPKTLFHAACPGQETATQETTQEATGQETASATQEETAGQETVEEATARGERLAREALDRIKRESRKAAPGSIDAVIDARIDARLEGFEPSASVSEETVRRIVREEAVQTTQITITRIDGSTAKVEGSHYNFERLINLYRAGIRAVYIWGPAGTGKTYAAMRVCEALGLNWELEGLDGSSPRSSLFGYRSPTGEPVLTPFLRTFADPLGGLVIDELDGSPGPLQVNLNSALANGHASTAWGAITRGEGFGLWGTGNGPGRPTPAHPERKNMAGAFKDRLYFMHWPLDRNIERRATGRSLVKPPARNGRARDITPQDWGRWIEEIRPWCEKNAPAQIHVSTRAVIEGLKALAAGETPEEVADGLIFKGADDSLVAKALEACPLP